MKAITRYNYEEFFMDYLDGTLSSLQLIVLEDFLSQNPDLRIELEEMECSTLGKDSVSMNSESLKEIPFRKSFDDFSIARLEGDLSVVNEISFDTFLENNEFFKEEHQKYKKTILLADTDLVCPDKNKLKRISHKLAYWWYISTIGAVASIVLIFLLWSTFYQFKGDYPSKERISAKIELSTLKRTEIVESRTLNSSETIENRKQATVELEGIVPKKKGQKKEQGKLLKKEKNQNIKKLVERVEPVHYSNDRTIQALTNSDASKIELDLQKNEGLLIKSKNNGLVQLGMLWKSSVPKNNAQNSVLYAIAKYGVDKLNEIAGKNVQLEKKYDSVTEKTRLDFNTTGIGFSKTIK